MSPQPLLGIVSWFGAAASASLFLVMGCFDAPASSPSQPMSPTSTDSQASNTYTNPVWPHNLPDPYIVRDGKRFLALGTHNNGDGFQCLESTDLVTWKALPAIAKPAWADTQYWAPEMYQWKGKWAFFYSGLDRATHKRDLAVTFSTSPTGPFENDHKLILGRDVNPGGDDNGAIDPTLYVEDGKPYLLYIREASPRAISIVPLSDDLTKVTGKAKDVILVDREIEKGVLDAPTLIKKDGTYWLFYSSGWFQSWKRDACYQVWAASSKSLMGPYTKPDKPVLTTKENEVYSPGHQCVFEASPGDWWIAYHGWSAEGEPMYGHNPQGRSLRIDRLTWTASGPVCDGPSSGPVPKPKL